MPNLKPALRLRDVEALAGSIPDAQQRDLLMAAINCADAQSEYEMAISNLLKASSQYARALEGKAAADAAALLKLTTYGLGG